MKRRENDMTRLTTLLIIAMAVIAAIVATGLIAGYAMQAWIVAYWLVLTMKNMVDYIGRRYPHDDI
jgi:hypothetical protein